MFNLRPPEKRPTRLEIRVASMSTSELFDWADSQLNVVGRGLSLGRRREHGGHWVDEVRADAAALTVIMTELSRRT